MSVSNDRWYFALDGDDVGFSVESVDDLDNKIKGAFSDIEEYVKNASGEVLFRGGDNLLCVAQGSPEEIADVLRNIFASGTSLSCTVGVASMAFEASKALRVGKHAGKDRTVVWGSAEEKVYNEVQAESQESENVESDSQDEGTLDYRAEAHYRRLVGAGYDPRTADVFVRQIYSDSYRDLLRNRKKNPLTQATPVEAYLVKGEIKWAQVEEDIEREAERHSHEAEATPIVEQKIVSNKSLGFVRFVGNRFVSVEWLNGQKERIALKNFKRSAMLGELKLVPKIRTARKNA